MKKKLSILIMFFIIDPTAVWYFEVFHDTVETVEELIGQNLDYAAKSYFGTDPDKSYSFSINQNLDEFQLGILTKKRPHQGFHSKPIHLDFF